VRAAGCVGGLVGLVVAVFVEGTLAVVHLYAGDVVAARREKVLGGGRGAR